MQSSIEILVNVIVLRTSFLTSSIFFSNKTRKAQELASLDNALREVRGVGLNQKLEEGMMGGAP